MRPIDYNGHIPDEPQLSDYQRGYNQALIDIIYAQLAKMREDLAAALEKDPGMTDHDVIIALVAFDVLLILLFLVVAIMLSKIAARLPR